LSRCLSNFLSLRVRVSTLSVRGTFGIVTLDLVLEAHRFCPFFPRLLLKLIKLFPLFADQLRQISQCQFRVLCTKDRTAMVVVEHVSRERSFQFLTVLVKHWCLLLLFLFVLVFLGVGFWVLVCSILFKSCLLFFGGFGIALRDIGSTFTVSNSIIRATSLLVGSMLE